MLNFVNPKTKNELIKDKNILYDSKTNEKVAMIKEGIPRFIEEKEGYLLMPFGHRHSSEALDSAQMHGHSPPNHVQSGQFYLGFLHQQR